MKKLTLFAATLGLAAAVNAQGLKGVGYDANLNHVVARLGVGPGLLDVGVALMFDGVDNGNSDDNLSAGVSGFYLHKLQQWGPVANYAVGGAVISLLPRADKNIAIKVFAGLQPEVTLLEHIVLSTRFGLDIPLMPDDQGFRINTVGSGISIVQGASFKILW